MDRITEFAIKNSRLTILLILFLIVGGLFSFFTIPSREDPAIVIRDAQVTAYYPGLSAQQMEDLVAIPIERAVKQVPEVDEITTTVKTGYVLVQPKVYDRYFNLEPIWQDLRNKMTDLKDKLPKETIGPYVNDDYGRVSEITIALSGDGFNLAELREVAKDLQDAMGQLDSVSRVDVYGIQDETVFLDFNGARLAHYGISPNQIMNTIRSQNVVLPSGTVVADGQRITIQPSGDFQSLEEIRNVQIHVPGTSQSLFLRDIVEVSRAYIDPPRNPVYFNNKPAVILALSMMDGMNIDTFEQDVTRFVKGMKPTLPLGMNVDYATYQPTLVKAAVAGAVSNLKQAIAIVLCVVILFLGLRTGLIVGTLVPLTILMSIVVMSFIHVDLQRMSIAAIIISLGLLIDNAIVIAEDMRRRMDQGTPKREAALAAASSLGIPLLSSTLTTIFAFMPLMWADNVTGEFVRSLGTVIIVSLLSSWFLAIYVTPTLCYWFLSERDAPKQSHEDIYNKGWYLSYTNILKIIMNQKIIFLGIMVTLLGFAISGFGSLVTQIMPPSDRNQFLVYLDLAAGSDITETVKATRILTEWLEDKKLNPEVTSTVAYVGSGGPRFFLSLSPVNPDTNTAFVVVNTRSEKDTKPLVDRTNRKIAEAIPEVTGRAKQMWLGPTEIGMMEYRISGPDAGTLFKLADDFERELRNIPGMLTVTDDWQNPVIRILMKVDQAGARRVGVTTEMLSNALRAYFDGTQITDYREGDKIIPVIVRGEEDVNTLDRLMTLPVLSQNKQVVPLIQFSNTVGTIVPEKIMRFNQERTITVSAKHQRLQASELHKMMLPVIAKFPFPPGYRIEYGGEIEGAQKANLALFKFLPHALAIIALILVWQFNSIRRAAIIMLTIPLVLIGAVFGLLATGTFLSFNAMLGMFSLAGIIVNNGIVLIDRMDSQRALGRSLEDAVISACVVRLRPILMTTVTTVLGLIPMVISGGDLWFGMAVVMICGLSFGTALTLGIIPILYYIFFKGNFSFSNIIPKSFKPKWLKIGHKA
ncbi:MAG: efflux RND transporter permease subunit [Alphaproteobacteria bacterium]|jgi:multidrug efflux pump subunit AcrB|nr:efflux RND transporter permease subunit [Alphaproteobacteria bacterium]